MPKYRVTYFHDEGRAETARQMLEIAKAQWEDVRLMKPEWDELKAKTPFSQLPILEELESGFQLAQSNAINRYLANKFGLGGKTPEDVARVDMIMEYITDFVKPIEDIFLETDEAHKAKLMEKFNNGGLEQFIKNFEAILIKNQGGNGYFVGDEMTVADILFLEASGWSPLLGCPIDWEKYPKLKDMLERVRSEPAIAAWIKKRPAARTDPDQ